MMAAHSLVHSVGKQFRNIGTGEIATLRQVYMYSVVISGTHGDRPIFWRDFEHDWVEVIEDFTALAGHPLKPKCTRLISMKESDLEAMIVEKQTERLYEELGRTPHPDKTQCRRILWQLRAQEKAIRAEEGADADGWVTHFLG